MNWQTVGNIRGADGENIELRANSTHIQWKPVSSVTWIDLIELSELKGPKGDTGPQGPKGDSGDGGGGGEEEPIDWDSIINRSMGDSIDFVEQYNEDEDDYYTLLSPAMSIAVAFNILASELLSLKEAFDNLNDRYNERFGESDWTFDFVRIQGVDVFDNAGNINNSRDGVLYVNTDSE